MCASLRSLATIIGLILLVVLLDVGFHTEATRTRICNENHLVQAVLRVCVRRLPDDTNSLLTTADSTTQRLSTSTPTEQTPLVHDLLDMKSLEDRELDNEEFPLPNSFKTLIALLRSLDRLREDVRKPDDSGNGGVRDVYRVRDEKSRARRHESGDPITELLLRCCFRGCSPDDIYKVC